MKNQHTPGPWIRSKSGNTFQIVAGKDLNEEPNTLVANIPPIGYNCDYEPCDETKANARLIAAAPELLSALRECVNVLAEHSLYDDDGDSAEGFARLLAMSAIAKAEGAK